KDADRIMQQFQERVIADDVSIKQLKAKDATRANILENIREIGRQTSKDDLVVFYYSGHGSRRADESAETPDRMARTFVAYDGQLDVSEVISQLQTIKAYRLVVIIDA